MVVTDIWKSMNEAADGPPVDGVDADDVDAAILLIGRGGPNHGCR